MAAPDLGKEEFKRVVRELREEAKAQRGGQISAREFVDIQSGKLPQEFLKGAESWIAKDEAGPAVGTVAPDFFLKRLDMEEMVRLSDYRGKRPVALIMGSYT